MTYIAPRSKVYAHLGRLVGWQQGRKPAPVTVEWDLSNRCVLGCQDCHFAHTHTRGPWVTKDRRLPLAFEGSGDLADAVVVRRALRQMADAGVQGIVWSGGGEPTAHPDWLELVGRASAAGLQQGMYTCGGLLTEHSALQLGWHAAWVVVSLDCADAKSYAAEKGVPESRFEAARNGVRWLANANTAVVGVSFLLHGGNWTRADEMREFGLSLGAHYVTFRPAIRVSQDKPSVCTDDRAWVTDAMPTFRWLATDSRVEIDPERFEDYRDWSGHGYTCCEGVKLNTTVTPDGRVWFCPQRRGVGQPLGDLSRESFSDIWARHPGHYTVDENCRVMCRLHPVNQQLAAMSAPRQHEAFV